MGTVLIYQKLSAKAGSSAAGDCSDCPNGAGFMLSANGVAE